MNKRFHIYIESNKALIYPAGKVSEDVLLPDSKPLAKLDECDDLYEWCVDHGAADSDDAVTMFRKMAIVPIQFIPDLEKKAQEMFDEYRKGGKALGWGELIIDHYMDYTFRGSADWKNRTTFYTINQPLKWTARNPNSIIGDYDALRVRDKYLMLLGMAEAVKELGMILVYDSEFKFSVKAVNTSWVAKEVN